MRLTVARPQSMPAYAMVMAVVFAFSLCAATPVLAFPDNGTAPCESCHGHEGGGGNPIGPHGGYTTGTQKCASCHAVHGSPSAYLGTIKLMEPSWTWDAFTVSATCITCHDGTGGKGVYGTILAMTGDPGIPISGHRVDQGDGTGMEVPAGEQSGSSVVVEFSGWDGGLSCGDCHSPHGANIVEPFVGDRLRKDPGGSGEPQDFESSRLLKRSPGPGDAEAQNYGSDWCMACHKGMHASGNITNTVADGRHAVASEVDGWHYGSVRHAQGEPPAYTTGPLGGGNNGYLLPRSLSGQDRQQPGPICQQCHEDARAVGNVTSFVLDDEEAHNPSLYGIDEAGNPRFQNFPHEGMGRRLLIEDAPDPLCNNCHLGDPGQGN